MARSWTFSVISSRFSLIAGEITGQHTFFEGAELLGGDLNRRREGVGRCGGDVGDVLKRSGALGLAGLLLALGGVGHPAGLVLGDLDPPGRFVVEGDGEGAVGAHRVALGDDPPVLGPVDGLVRLRLFGHHRDPVRAPRWRGRSGPWRAHPGR